MQQATPRGLFRAAFLLCAVALVYANALHGTFHFDDYGALIGNAKAQQWGAWWQDLGHGIRPLLKLSFVLNGQVSTAPASYIAFNLLVHGLNALLVWRLLRRWLGAGGDTLALAAALLWALHPAQTEAVSYISGRSVSLSTLFVLLTVVGYEHWRDGRAAWWPCVLAYAAALGVKETTAITPLLLVLVELRRGMSWRAALTRTAPWWAATLLLALAAIALTRYAGFWSVSAATRSAAANLLAQVDGIAYLLAVLTGVFAPNIDPTVPVAKQLTVVLGVMAAGLLALIAWAIHRAPRSLVAWGVLWFFAALLPTNSVFPRLDVANDRQLYLASLGAVLALAAMLKSSGLRPALVAAALMALALLAGTRTVVRNADYASAVMLWQASLREAPGNVRALTNLGLALDAHGERPAAVQQWRQALAIQPDYQPAQRALLMVGALP